MNLDGAALARDFAEGMRLADARAPTWASYRPGLGPHTEVQTVALVMAELARTHPAKYGAVRAGVPLTWTPPWLRGQVARVCRTSGSDRHIAATSAGVR